MVEAAVEEAVMNDLILSGDVIARGSAKIKTGNRIKVDGTEEVVYILE